jgi:hypothetical protein
MRHCLAVLVAAVGIYPAAAQEWPSGTVRVVVPYAAGGPVDVPARLVIDRLTAQTKGTFILENRPGAGGSIGLQSVMQSPPDGSTFLFTTSSVTIVPTSIEAQLIRCATTMISLITDPILAVRANHPIRDLAGLIAYAKANPGKLTFASGGVGTGNHMAGELLKKLAGIDMLHVPYKGTAPALTSLYAGDIDLLFVSTIEAVPHAQPHPVLGSARRRRCRNCRFADRRHGAGPRPTGVARTAASCRPRGRAPGREDATAGRSAVIGMPMLLTPPESWRAVEAEVPPGTADHLDRPQAELTAERSAKPSSVRIATGGGAAIRGSAAAGAAIWRPRSRARCRPAHRHGPSSSAGAAADHHRTPASNTAASHSL